MANPKYAAQVVLFNPDTAEISIEGVVDAQANMVETETAVYSLEDAKTYIDAKRQKVVYVFNADLPSRVEASNLKLLRRSMALKQLFNFERGSEGIKWGTILPYIVIIALIFFK
jgi:hypothetical protein